MTNSEKKKILLKYRDLLKELDSLTEEKTRWISRAEKITPTFSLSPKGGATTDKIQNAVDKICEIQVSISDKMLQIIAERNRIYRFIYSVDDERLKAILIYIYIDGIKLTDLEDVLHLEYRQLKRLHGRALSLVQINDVL